MAREKIISDVLKRIIQQYGEEVLSQTYKFNALISDMLPCLERKYKYLLKVAVESGAYFEIAKATANNREAMAQKVKQKLIDEYLINENSAEKVVSWIIDTYRSTQTADNTLTIDPEVVERLKILKRINEDKIKKAIELGLYDPVAPLVITKDDDDKTKNNV